MIPLVFIVLYLPLLLITVHIYSTLTSPFRHLPSIHWTAPHTSLYNVYLQLTGRENRALHRAHNKLQQPVVRVGPTALSFSSPSAIKQIYTANLPKSAWYSVFANYGSPPMFAMLDNRAHAARKRIVAGFYSNSAIARNPALHDTAAEVVPALLTNLRTAAAATPTGVVDVWPHLNAATMDLTTALLFTRAHSTRFSTAPAELHRFLHAFHSRRPWFPLAAALPRLAAWLTPRWVARTNTALEAWCSAMARACVARPARGPPACVADLLHAALPATADRDAELLDHLGAGHETTALALSFTLAALAAQPDLQAALFAEVAGHRRTALERLWLLNGVVREGLRLYAPIPGPQPRVVPPGAGATIAGVFCPPGTTVAVAPAVLHRDRAASPDSQADGEGEVQRVQELRERDVYWWPFGGGARGCVGRWAALWELKVLVAAIVEEFEVFPVGEAEELAERARGRRRVNVKRVRRGRGRSVSEKRERTKDEAWEAEMKTVGMVKVAEGVGLVDAYTTAPVGGAVRLVLKRRGT
ncbi:cytochrome P450 [Geopyxis carbonaria]|nr:cytochrome P450 [Geopyxis carbonaria]